MSASTSVKEVDVATAKAWLDGGQAVLVDVREPAEYASAYITQATLLPLAQVTPDNAPAHEGKKLIVQCQGGGRSAKAARIWQGADEVYSLAGGINAWKQAGYPVNQAARRPGLDVQRQLQLTIGLGVLTGVLLGAFVSPWFLWLAGLFGAGLTMAGITGVCPLAIFIARMPWNKRFAVQPVTGQSATPSCCLPRQ